MADVGDFVTRYNDKFNLNGLTKDDREKLVVEIITTLEKESTSLDSSQIVTALNAIRILSRDKHHINVCASYLCVNKFIME